MLETALDTAADARSGLTDRLSPLRRVRRSVYGYSILFLALCVGWLLRGEQVVNPEEGLGYWLGIVGGSLMLLLLLYPAGKKSSLLRRLGLVKHWFRIHMIMGLLGPLLVLYHCNFQVGAMNSKVALFSMLGVALSGIVGRHIYTRIHRGLYGKRAHVEELRAEISDSVQTSRGIAVFLPGLINELHSISTHLMGDDYTRTVGIRKSLSWTIMYHVMRVRLFFAIRREVQVRAVLSHTVNSKSKSLRVTANAYAKKQLGLMRQVAQLSLYERLFSFWHIFHMPLFLLLVISALVHVLAVHMY